MQDDARISVDLNSLLQLQVGDLRAEAGFPKLFLQWETAVIDQYLNRTDSTYVVHSAKTSPQDVQAIDITVKRVALRLECPTWMRCDSVAGRLLDGYTEQLALLNWFRKALDAKSLVLFILDAQLIDTYVVSLNPVPRKSIRIDSRQRSNQNYPLKVRFEWDPNTACSIRAQLALLYTCAAEAGLVVGSLHLQATPSFVIKTKRYTVPVSSFLVRARLKVDSGPRPLADQKAVGQLGEELTQALPPACLELLQSKEAVFADPTPFFEAQRFFNVAKAEVQAALTPSQWLLDAKDHVLQNQWFGVPSDAVRIEVMTPAEAAVAYSAKYPRMQHVVWLTNEL